MQSIYLSNKAKWKKKTLLVVRQGSILLKRLANTWFIWLPSQIMAALFPSAFFISLRIKFGFSNIHFGSSSSADNILYQRIQDS